MSDVFEKNFWLRHRSGESGKLTVMYTICWLTALDFCILNVQIKIFEGKKYEYFFFLNTIDRIVFSSGKGSWLFYNPTLDHWSVFHRNTNYHVWLNTSFLEPNYRNMFAFLIEICRESAKRVFFLPGRKPLVGSYTEVRAVIRAMRQSGHQLHYLIWHSDIWAAGQLQLFIWYFTAPGAWHNMSLTGRIIKSPEHK